MMTISNYMKALKESDSWEELQENLEVMIGDSVEEVER
jgi:hypothetical protein